MSILSKIFGKIFPSSEAKTPTAPTAQTPPTPSTTSAGPAPGNKPIPMVDVKAMLNAMADKSGQKLNWDSSIVDLMKLLDLDSSLTSRKELAQELHYTGDTNDSATMNIWLHKQVMIKLAQNGGVVPAELKD